jgi:23S rRNA (cytidine1920-2'-O)/16S rRNA (cytidine1409-2'-O)-methyltransferase
MEKTDIRDLDPEKVLISAAAPKIIDLIVIDVSFISLTNIADAIARWKSPRIVALIKPQFEVPREVAARADGIVRSEKDRRFAIDKVVRAFENANYKKIALTESPIKGGSGNVEYLALFQL